MKISVFIPTKDRPDWLPRAVKSVLDQSYTNWELVILDNSVETGPQNRWLRNRKIRYVREECEGVADACSKALALCTGDICTFLGDDDRLPPQAFERVADAFTQWPRPEWLYAITELRRMDESVICHRGHIPFSLAELRNWYYLGGAVYWRRGLSDRLGGYQQAFDGAADYDLYLRFAEDVTPVWLPEVLYLYTDWEGTDSRQRAANQHQKTQEIVSAAAIRG